jgi:hypothetical protein
MQMRRRITATVGVIWNWALGIGHWTLVIGHWTLVIVVFDYPPQKNDPLKRLARRESECSLQFFKVSIWNYPPLLIHDPIAECRLSMLIADRKSL